MKGRTAACMLVTLVLLPALTACGGSGTSSSTKAEQARTEAQWRAGLARWHREVRQALDGISLLFATTGSVSGLTGAHTRAAAALAAYEQTLASCATTVERLGPVPEGFGPARRYALQACTSLQRGERMVEAAVAAMKRGATVDLSPVTGPLSDGQNEADAAATALPATASP